jgi:PAS domain S-box-containing protein
MDKLREETIQTLLRRYYVIIIACLGVILWLGAVWLLPSPQGATIPIILITFFFTFLTTFPIHTFQIDIALNQILFIGAGIIYGPTSAIWSAMVGVSLGMIGRQLFKTSKDQAPKEKPFLRFASTSFYEIGILMIPFAIVALVFWGQGQPDAGYFLTTDALISILSASFIYVFVHMVLILGAIWLNTHKEEIQLRDSLVSIGMMELLPLPFILISVIAFPTIDLASIGIIGGISAILSVLLFESTKNRADLERRVQDLSLLNEISQVIRYSTGLDNLLKAIWTQVSHLMRVRNFYVAIFDQVDETIWYPLAVKNNQSQSWQRRALMNRLTDRVIQGKRPIMLSRDVQKELEKIGAPLGDEPLYAWLGVPLITPNRIVGCLAVFSLTPDITFDEDDLNLLTTLSGQVSIALENALIVDETGKTLSRQTKQLNIMEMIGRQLSASLHSDELFELILDYALEFTQSPLGSLTVFNPVTDAFEIKAYRGGKGGQEKSSGMEGISERVIRTGKPVMVNDFSKDFEGHIAANNQSKAQLTVPIINKDQVIGMINLESPNLNEYTESELNFVSQLADQATLAINNAALYEKAQRTLREQATLYLISSRLAVYHELDSVLNAVAQAFSAALDSFLTGVYLWDANSQTYRCEAVMEREHDYQIELPPTISSEDWVEIRKQRTVTGPLQIPVKKRKLAKIIKLKKGCQSLIFPLQIADQNVGLVLNHLSDTRVYHGNELQFPQAIAAQGSIAIQNALLFSDVSMGLDRLETVLNAVGEGVLMVDAHGRVTLANMPIAALTGLRIDEIMGRNLMDLPSDFYKPLGLSAEEVSGLTLDSAKQGDFGLTSRRNYGFQERFYERTIAPVWTANDQILGWVIVVRDVTEEKVISQTRELLTETLVHDLRSPIGAIKTTLELIQEEISKSESSSVTDQSLDIAQRSADRVLALIDSLLDISQLESGNLDIETKPSDIHVIISDAIGELIQQANEDGIILHEGDRNNLPLVQIDENLIRRVITNLLDNALKFTPEGGIVAVVATKEMEDFVTVRVSDTGPGIPEDYREIVFRRFSQIPGLRGRRRGSGLGLTFCQLVVEAHQGRIWIEPGENQVGATLAFNLPIIDGTN